MSTRERVHTIVDKLSEEQLHAFLVIFESTNNIENDERAEKEKAYNELISMLEPLGDIDEKAELAAYRDERYGEGL